MPHPLHDDSVDSPRLLNRPLAIVGMACRLPGADGLQAFWDLLLTGSSAIERMPDEKLNRELYFDPDKGRRGKTYSDIGGFISQREVDWSLLPFAKSEAGDWDRSHLILCEVAAAACRDAGWNPRDLPLRNGAVFVGHSGGSTLGGELAYRILAPEYVKLMKGIPGLSEMMGSTDSLKESLEEALLKRVQAGRPERNDAGRPYSEAGFAAGIISRAFGLTGPHMSIDAACASSLVALALAAATLQTGQSDVAIVGGASFNKSDSLILFSQAQSCSASGSRPFDEDADGLISSEGYVAIVLKTLERAQADGDRVQAVIHGIGISSDGRGKSLWAPRKEGQYTAIGRAYSADVTPASVQLVEAHATSTQVGDATEMEALSQFFREHCAAGQRIPVGSVKSNIGHTLETAGLAGLVKAVLSIQHATVPPSINVRNLSQSIPWSQIPLYVPHVCEPWPLLPAAIPRRAAVNAFGIGGLNVHVVVEQYLPPVRPSTRSPRAPHAGSHQPQHVSEPIAVIGRGLVLPGAANLVEFQSLLKSGMSQIGARDNSVSAEEMFIERQGRFLRLPMVGGFVRGFEYDWRKHKVPPKQIAQANPLQFMLLEAAEQALREAKCFEREFDRQNTAVVVGSIFGGDFGNALFAGLRLPEFKDQLYQLLLARGVSAVQANEWTKSYEDKFLKINPALLDETGSFTSSTLASRLSKTFDLMGGALAIDSGDVSSFAALQASSQLLQSRAVNQVMCAAAHRSLDRAALETLARLGCLPGTSANINEGYHVGEGVAVVLLKRLSDARRDGDTIWTTIAGIAAGFDANSLERSLQTASSKLNLGAGGPVRVVGGNGIQGFDQAIARGLSQAEMQPSPLVKLTGHLQATQGLADLIATTLADPELGQSEQPVHQIVLAGHTLSGQSYVLKLDANQPAVPLGSPERARRPRSEETGVLPERARRPRSEEAGVLPERARRPRSEEARELPGESQMWRFAAKDAGELQTLLARSAQASHSQLQMFALSHFPSEHGWRAAIVCDEQALASKLALAARQIGVEATRIPMAEQGIFWSATLPRPTRVAWLFPGQGSQYRGMLEELVEGDQAAATALSVADNLLASMGQPSFKAIAGHDAESLGEDVWFTQAAMLIADWVMLETLRSRGYSPNLVCGHSFGEFAAMLAAGCWDLENALRATWFRCQAITRHVPTGFGMLSIQADAMRVQELLSYENWGISISHINAAQQIVVGGKHAAVVGFAQVLDDAGINSRVLAVPTAFHTSALQPAQATFERDLATVTIEPPRLPLLSSVTNRYEADPEQLAANLVQQLVQPIDFAAMCQRLRRDGVSLVVEVGPQQVLTRLVRQNVDEALQAIATDQPKRSGLHQLLCAEAQLQLRGGANIAATHGLIPASIANKPRTMAIHHDATQTRRDRMRATGRAATLANAPYGSAGETPAVRPVAALANASHGSAGETPAVRPVAALANAPYGSAGETPAVRPVAALANAPYGSAGETPAVRPATGSATRESLPIEKSLVSTPTSTIAHTPKFIETFLIDFVVEQTGYPAEIIELDWDIEADLGIDSIKKAQLFGELREFFDLETLKSLPLDSFRTLRDIATLLERTPGKSDWLAQPIPAAPVSPETAVIQSASVPTASVPTATASFTIASQSETVVPTSSAVRDVEHVSHSSNSEVEKLALSTSQLQQFLIDFVVEQTGYPEEIVELDADLEADLGIDSIKKAQLFGELREMFQFSAQPESSAVGARQGLADYRTLRNVLDAMTDANPVSARQEIPEFEAPPAEISNAATRVIQPNVVGRDWASILLTQHGNGSANQATMAYREALHCNLRAMVGRKELASTNLQTRGNGTTHIRSLDTFSLASTDNAELANNAELAKRIALAVETSVASVHSLSDAMLIDSGWQLGPPGVLAQFCSPTWLQQGGGRAAAIMVREAASGTSIMIGPAGSATPTAAIHHFTLLVLGDLIGRRQVGQAALSRAAKARLSAWMQHAADKSTLEHCIRDASRIRIAQDWWLLLVDAKTQEQAYVESRQGVLAIERGTVSPLSVGEQRPQVPALSIHLEGATQRFSIASNGTAVHSGYHNCRLDEAWLQAVQTQSHTLTHTYPSENQQEAAQAVAAQATDIAARYVLQMSPAPQPQALGRLPEWSGAALVVGENPIALHLEECLRRAGVFVTRLPASEDASWLSQQLEQLSAIHPVKHLFIATPCDAEASITLDAVRWNERRNKGVLGIYWLCQRWLNQVIANEWADDASLVAISALGGDFGFSGNLHSAEGGGVGGLLKSILIEGWMQGLRTLPIKVIDTYPGQAPAEVVDQVWSELAVPSYDLEVSYVNGRRHVVRAIPRPVFGSGTSIPRDGTWVCTGGARGITAFVAEKLAIRHALTLHLLGTAQLPQIDATWHDLDDSGLRRLKAQVMTSARDAGQNPVKTWQNTEKALEIDATLRRFAVLGIEAHYHACDVSNRSALRATLETVRRISGPIEGVLHGAGVGKDARFDRKQPEKVQQCIAAKVDGALALMEATQGDPLKYFIGFGSISGRFGANGHTDYSLANEMLCKQIDWFKRQRPEVKAIGFHWHAWGDVGMATKPETRLALEMIDMQFMPAEEGMRHLIAELEGDSDATEVLITDDRYYRAFYPAETLIADTLQVAAGIEPVSDAASLVKKMTLPLLTAVKPAEDSVARNFNAKVDPGRDPFLVEHTLDGSPLLPFVIASEMFMEAAVANFGQKQRTILLDIEAVQGLRFFTTAPRELNLESQSVGAERVELKLNCDFLSRDGRLVEANRTHFKAVATTRRLPEMRVELAVPANADWQRVVYPSSDSKFQVGWPFQRLRKIVLTQDGLIGKISAPALIELAGSGRDLHGWQIPCAAMDACLFAVGVLAWRRVEAGTALPVRIGRLDIGRLPRPGEACQVHVRLLSQAKARACFDFTLQGIDGDVILNACDYEVAWLMQSSGGQADAPAARGSSNFA